MAWSSAVSSSACAIIAPDTASISFLCRVASMSGASARPQALAARVEEQGRGEIDVHGVADDKFGVTVAQRDHLGLCDHHVQVVLVAQVFDPLDAPDGVA